MPEKKKPADEQVEEAVDRYMALKKAGMPTVWVLVITLLSTPGFYSTFFDSTADDADRKAAVAYEVLKKEVEQLRSDDKDLEEEIRNLRQYIMLLQLDRAEMAKSIVDTIPDGQDKEEDVAVIDSSQVNEPVIEQRARLPRLEALMIQE